MHTSVIYTYLLVMLFGQDFIYFYLQDRISTLA